MQSYLRYYLAITLYVVVVFAFGVFDIVRQKLNLPISGFDSQFSFLIPLLLILYMGLYRSKGCRSRCWTDWFFVSTILVFTLIETGHFIFSQADSINYDSALRLLWAFTVLYILTGIHEVYNIKIKLQKACHFVILFLLTLQLLTYMSVFNDIYIPFNFQDRPQAEFVSTSSFIALFGIWLLIFPCSGTKELYSFKERVILLLVYTSFIYVGHMRSVVVMMVVVYSIFIVGLIKYTVLRVVGYVVIGALLILYLSNFTGETIITSSEMERYFTKDKSVEIRTQSNLVALKYIYNNFFFGLGSGLSQSVKYEWANTHTYYIKIMLQYGFVGIAVLFIAVGSFLKRYHSVRTYMGLILIGSIMTFVPNLYWWYTIILFYIGPGEQCIKASDKA